MTKIDERTAANMDVVLEEVCRDLTHGGDDESRKHVAQKLMQAAKKGNETLEGCEPWPVARFPNYRGANRPRAKQFLDFRPRLHRAIGNYHCCGDGRYLSGIVFAAG
jgi:hypothetical protein